MLKCFSEAERCFERLVNVNGGLLPQGPGITEALNTAVLQNTGDLDLFPELREHQFDTTVMENHLLQLVKKVAGYYIKVRMHHLAKEKTAELAGPKVRKTYKKLIQFKNQ